jgi:hypothetical protein
MSPSERGRILWKLADLIEKRAEEFATLPASLEQWSHSQNSDDVALCRGIAARLALKICSGALFLTSESACSPRRARWGTGESPRRRSMLNACQYPQLSQPCNKEVALETLL